MAFAFTVFVCSMIIVIMSIISIQVVIQSYKIKHTTDPINHKLEVGKIQEHPIYTEKKEHTKFED